MEVPHISSSAEDEAAEARIDEMAEDQLRNELAANGIARNHLIEEEREFRAALILNRSTQTKLRRRGQAITQRLAEIQEESGSALPVTPDEGLE